MSQNKILGTKFHLGDTIYHVNDTVLTKGVIIEIHLIYPTTGQLIKYKIKNTVGKEYLVNEASLVYTFKEAKQALLNNLENSYKTRRDTLLKFTKEVHEQQIQDYLQNRKGEGKNGKK